MLFCFSTCLVFLCAWMCVCVLCALDAQNALVSSTNIICISFDTIQMRPMYLLPNEHECDEMSAGKMSHFWLCFDRHTHLQVSCILHCIARAAFKPNLILITAIVFMCECVWNESMMEAKRMYRFWKKLIHQRPNVPKLRDALKRFALKATVQCIGIVQSNLLKRYLCSLRSKHWDKWTALMRYHWKPFVTTCVC